MFDLYYLALDVVSSASSVAIMVQVLDSAELLLRVAVERLGLDTAKEQQCLYLRRSASRDGRITGQDEATSALLCVF